MFCKNCGKEIKGGSEFCPFCGKAVKGTADASNIVKESSIQEIPKKSASAGTFDFIGVVCFVIAIVGVILSFEVYSWLGFGVYALGAIIAFWSLRRSETGLTFKNAPQYALKIFSEGQMLKKGFRVIVIAIFPIMLAIGCYNWICTDTARQYEEAVDDINKEYEKEMDDVNEEYEKNMDDINEEEYEDDTYDDVDDGTDYDTDEY